MPAELRAESVSPVVEPSLGSVVTLVKVGSEHLGVRIKAALPVGLGCDSSPLCAPQPGCRLAGAAPGARGGPCACGVLLRAPGPALSFFCAVRLMGTG